MARKGRLRDLAALALVVLASISLFWAVVSIYTATQLGDSERFADRVVSSLDDEQVRRAAGEQLTNEIINEVNPDLIAARPLIEAAAIGLVGSDPFKAALRTGLRAAHRNVFSEGNDSTLAKAANVGILASEALKRLDPKLAKQVPADVDSALVKVGEGGLLTDLAQGAHAVSEFALALAVLTLLLYAAAIAVAADRRRASTRAGISVAVAGAGVFLCYLAGSALVAGSVDGDPESGAFEAIWSALFGAIAGWGLGICALGAVVAAAASSLLRTPDVQPPLLRLRAWALETPESKAWRIARGAAILLAGIFAIASPLLALKILTVAAGLLIAYVGTSEILESLFPPIPRASARSRAKQAQARRTALRRGAIVAGAAVVGIAVVALVSSTTTDTVGAGPVTECNGSERLCDVPFDQVAIPATHNSMSGAKYPGFLSPEQETTIPGQLGDGVRGLLIDAYYGYPGNRVLTDEQRSSSTARELAQQEFGDEFTAAADRLRAQISRPDPDAESKIFFCHGFCELGALDAEQTLRGVASFLEQNPGEVVVIVIEDYVEPRDMAEVIENSGLGKYVYEGPTGPGEWPTLREMIDSGERLVVMAEHRAKGAPAWYHRAYGRDGLVRESPYDFKRPEQMSCRPNRGPERAPLFLINNWISSDPAPKPSNSAIVNARRFLLDRVRNCRRLRSAEPGLIAVNFYRQGDLFEVVDKLNAAQ